VGREDDAGWVRARALELGAPHLAAALRGRTHGEEQSSVGVTYAHKIEPPDRRIEWAGTAVDAANLVRALSPHIGARTELDGQLVTVWRARPEPGEGEPGVIGPPLRIGCGEGVLDVLELQPAGRRRMAAADYLRGLRRPPERAA
jgi:methionyl-tRNA formyltransferase